MKTCYIYVRVSTEEQRKKGYSPDNQKRQCRDYAGIHGYHVLRIFDDSGRSGRHAETRPELQELLRSLDTKPVDAIVIYKIDRFARNVTDFSRIFNLIKAKNIKLISVNEGDLTEGQSLVPNILASVAQWESEANSSRTKDGLAEKFETGWQPSPLYIGYVSVGKKDERKTCKPCPVLAPILKEMFELYATGNYNILEIQDWLADKNLLSRNGTVISHSVINGILKNPFYYGLIRWHGQSKMGKHKPIISKQLFDTCQFVLAKHRNFLLRKRKHDYLLRGFIFCNECDQRYTAEPHPNHSTVNPKKIDYYHCQKRGRNGCTSPYIEQGELETQVEGEIDKMQFSQEFIDKVVQRTREVLDESRRTIGAQRQALINKKIPLEARRNKLEDALLDGTIEDETYKRKHVEINEKILNINFAIQDVEAKAQIDITLIEEVLAFTRNIHKAYMEAPKFLKRHYLRFFFEKIYVKNKQISRTVPTPIFLILQANHQVIIRNARLRD